MRGQRGTIIMRPKASGKRSGTNADLTALDAAALRRVRAARPLKRQDVRDFRLGSAVLLYPLVPLYIISGR